MLGLPKDTDFLFLRNEPLTQIAVGLHELILRFGDDIAVTTASECEVHKPGKGNLESDNPGVLAELLLDQLGHSICAVELIPPGALKVNFETGTTLEFRDTSDVYESYHVRHFDKVFVV